MPQSQGPSERASVLREIFSFVIQAGGLLLSYARIRRSLRLRSRAKKAAALNWESRHMAGSNGKADDTAPPAGVHRHRDTRTARTAKRSKTDEE